MTAATGAHRRSWRNFLVKKRLQLRFIVFIGITLLCLMITLCGMTSWAIEYFIEVSDITDPSMLYRLAFLKKTIYLTSTIVVTANFGLLAWLSHFVAGPLYRLERTFEQMQTGDISMTIRLRKDDELKDTVALLNVALTRLRALLAQERTGVDKTLDQFRTLSEKWKAEGHASEADSLRQTLDSFERNARQIKIETPL